MRMSCNGCRVLRKGCSDDCSIRPCLDWIKTPDSQAHATVFLAKFYGRAGLMNLVNAGPQHLRPAIFRSLLYEACGRIVNPIYGSVGLLWSGSWQLCQNAVEAVLKGVPITQIPTDAAENKAGPPLKAYDIRHVNRPEDNLSGSSNDLHRVRNRFRFKRDGAAKPRRSRVRVRAGSVEESGPAGEVRRSPSHESSLSHQSAAEAAAAETNVGIENTARESESLASAACESASEDEGEIELDLTLGFEPFKRAVKPKEMAVKEAEDDGGAGLCKMELRLDCAVRGFNGSD